MLDEHGGEMARSRVVWGWIQGMGALAALIAVPAMFLQWFGIYFTIGGTTPAPTAHEIRLNVITGTVALVGSTAAVVGALVLEHRALLALHLVGALLAVGVFFLFPVPSNRWEKKPEVNHLPSDYHQCYSGSGDCVGG